MSAAILIFLAACGTSVIATISEVPMSQNVSAGQTVELACATTSAADIISWTHTPIESTTKKIVDLPGGGHRSLLRFTASLNHSDTIIRCIVTNQDTSISVINTAHLLVQGLLSAVDELNSTVLNQCTLHFTWTAPYTLQGVPINYYTINITRHSGGAVLRSDTTNTTKYTYYPNILGEMLEISVAAANDAGTGEVSQIVAMSPSSITNLMLISILKKTEKDRTHWIYTFSMQENTICSNAIGIITVEACLNSYCDNAQVFGNMTMLSQNMHERSLVVNFSTLMDNRIYSSILQIDYNGGLLQQSLPISISTFDVRNISLNQSQPITEGRVCLNVDFVDGYETPAEIFILFKSNKSNFFKRLNETSTMCVQNVPPNSTYDIFAIDGDAKDQIDTAAAVNITGVFVPYYVPPTTPSSTIVTATNSPTTETVIVASVVGVVFVAAAAVGGLVVFIVIVVVVNRWKSQNHNAERNIELNRYQPTECQNENHLGLQNNKDNQDRPPDKDPPSHSLENSQSNVHSLDDLHGSHIGGDQDQNGGGHHDGSGHKDQNEADYQDHQNGSHQDHNRGGHQDHNGGHQDHNGGHQDHNRGGHQDHNGGHQDHNRGGHQDHNRGGHQDHNGGHQDHNGGHQDHNGGHQDHNGGHQDHNGGHQDHNGGQQDHQDFNGGLRDHNGDGHQNGDQIDADNEDNQDRLSDRNPPSHSLENSQDNVHSLVDLNGEGCSSNNHGSQSAGSQRKFSDINMSGEYLIIDMPEKLRKESREEQMKEQKEEQEERQRCTIS